MSVVIFATSKRTRWGSHKLFCGYQLDVWVQQQNRREGHPRPRRGGFWRQDLSSASPASALSGMHLLRGAYTDGHDIRVMVLLVADRGGDVPQQPQ